jgi:hypothetical protein
MARFEAEAYEMETARIEKKIADFWDTCERDWNKAIDTAIEDKAKRPWWNLWMSLDGNDHSM